MDITLVVSLDQAEMLWSLLADARGAHVNDPLIENEIATLQGVINEAIESDGLARRRALSQLVKQHGAERVIATVRAMSGEAKGR